MVLVESSYRSFLKVTWTQFTQQLFSMKLPKEGDDGLSKDEFDWSALKVIFQGLKGLKIVKFGYVAAFWKFSQKRSDNF